MGCPKWIKCKWRVWDFICIAGCEIKKGWNKFTAWAEQVGIKVRILRGDVITLTVEEKTFERPMEYVFEFSNERDYYLNYIF